MGTVVHNHAVVVVVVLAVVAATSDGFVELRWLYDYVLLIGPLAGY